MPKANAHKIPKAQLIAAAESFAGVSYFADMCYRYYFYGDKTAQTYLQSVLVSEFAEHLKDIPPRYHAKLIYTALLEISYPIKDTAKTAFSERERAITARISRQTFRSHGMNNTCDNIIGNIKGIALVVSGKIQAQLGYNFKIDY